MSLIRATGAGDFVKQGNGSELLVPKDLQRAREVITADEWRALHRCIDKVLGPRKIKFALACHKEGCQWRPIQRVQNAGGGFTLRCGCTDRVFTPKV